MAKGQCVSKKKTGSGTTLSGKSGGKIREELVGVAETIGPVLTMGRARGRRQKRNFGDDMDQNTGQRGWTGGGNKSQGGGIGL